MLSIHIYYYIRYIISYINTVTPNKSAPSKPEMLDDHIDKLSDLSDSNSNDTYNEND